MKRIPASDREGEGGNLIVSGERYTQIDKQGVQSFFGATDKYGGASPAP